MARPPVTPRRPELIAMAIGPRDDIEQLLRDGPGRPTRLVMPSNPGDPIIDCDLMLDGEQCAFGRGHSGPCLAGVPLRGSATIRGSLTMPPMSWPDGGPEPTQRRRIPGRVKIVHRSDFARGDLHVAQNRDVSLTRATRAYYCATRDLLTAARVISERVSAELGSSLANEWAAMSINEAREVVALAEQINDRMIELRDLLSRRASVTAVCLLKTAEDVEKRK